MALHVTDSSDFIHRYGNEFTHRPDLSSRYRINGLRTDRSYGNQRYKNEIASQSAVRYTGSSLPYQGYDGAGPHAFYDSSVVGTTTNLSSHSARKFPAVNCKDTHPPQNIYGPHKISTARLLQHESNPIFTDEFTHRGAIISERPYGTDVTRLLDTKRYAPSNYRLSQNVWNTSRDCPPSDYTRYHRSTKSSQPYSSLNNHALYEVSNNSSYIAEPRFYAVPQLQQRNQYISAYLAETSNGKQTQPPTTEKINGNDNVFPVAYRSGINAKEHASYRTKSFPSISLNNLNNIDGVKCEKNTSSFKDMPNSSNERGHYEDESYPSESEQLTPTAAKQKYGKYLTNFEKEEIHFYPEIYFVGRYAKKRQPSKTLCVSGTREYSFQGTNNSVKNAAVVNGYDDSQSGYIVVISDHIAYRYEVIKLLGKGSFGQVVQARDHKTGQDVALKIIRSEERFARQAKEEIQILQQLNEQDTEDKHNIVRLLDNFKFREHVCMVFELLSFNLYELLHFNEFRGLQQAEVCAFTKSILECLELLYKNKIIHCDLKPENVLLVNPKRSAIKVIDFGSSCHVNKRVYTYIQSRFYRAPEIIMGMSYGMEIDMWSLGCIVAEMITGTPLFPGEDADDQLALIMELLGTPPARMLSASKGAYKFFMCTGEPRYLYEQELDLEQQKQQQQEMSDPKVNGMVNGDRNIHGRSAETTNVSAKVRSKPKQRSRTWRPRQPPGSLDLLTVLTSSKNSSVCVPGGEKRNRRTSRTHFIHVEPVDPDMLDFVSRCLLWWPEDRMSPSEALIHPWIMKNKTSPKLDNILINSSGQRIGVDLGTQRNEVVSNGTCSTNDGDGSVDPDDLLQKMQNVRLRRPKMFVEDDLRHARRNSVVRNERDNSNNYRRYSTGHEYGWPIAALTDHSDLPVDRRHSVREGRRINGGTQFRDFLNSEHDRERDELSPRQRGMFEASVADVKKRHRPRRPSNQMRDTISLKVDDTRSRLSGNYDSTL